MSQGGCYKYKLNDIGRQVAWAIPIWCLSGQHNLSNEIVLSRANSNKIQKTVTNINCGLICNTTILMHTCIMYVDADVLMLLQRLPQSPLL